MGNLQIDWSNIIWPIATLMGALVGAFSSWLSSHTLESKRWKREDAKRHEADRRHNYLRLIKIANRLDSLKAEDKEIPPTMETEFSDVLIEIELLASPQTREHALAFGRAVYDRFFNPEKKQLSEEALYDRKRRFIESIRKELGIKTNILKTTEFSLSPMAKMDVPKDISEPCGNLTAQSQIPFHIATGGIGLLIAYAIPGGLSGGQGFLIGVFVGLVVSGYVAFHSTKSEAR